MSAAGSSIHYDTQFYADQVKGSQSSSQRILPFVIELLKPRSVVDVGCGVGTWLKVCLELGVDTIAGLDGDYVSRPALQIPQNAFTPTDLQHKFSVAQQFDLALCLEVAEHLPVECGPTLVTSLTEAAPAVLFSAAIPGQGGTYHINEQWQDYWRNHFKAAGYLAVDFVRPKVWGLPDVESWYQQNTILYCSQETLAALPSLAAVDSNLSLDLVHPESFLRVRDEGHQYFSKTIKLLPGLFAAAVTRKIGGSPSRWTR